MNINGGTGGGHLVFARSATMSYGGNISGNLDLALEGDSSLLILSSTNNNYTNGTDVEAGTLEVLATGGLPNGSALTVGVNGTVDLGDPPEAGSYVVATSLHGASSAGSVAAVPEPGTLALLARPESSPPPQLGGGEGIKDLKSQI